MGLLDRLRRRPAVPSSEIRAYFNRAAGDEEHYPSSIDPRIWHVKLVLEHLEACLGSPVFSVGSGSVIRARPSAVASTEPSAQPSELSGAPALPAEPDSVTQASSSTEASIGLAWSPGGAKRIADIGCGKGRYARIVKERWPAVQVVAVDLAEAMLAHVPANIARAAASMTALPIASGAMDAAYATESLEHAVDIPAAVAELARIVKPGGRIVVIDKNAEAWGRLDTPEWERWFGRKELERLLQRHCRRVWSQPISYWEDVPPDGLFLAWFGER